MNDLEKAYQIGFLHGQVKGITDYAVWKDGQQLVGIKQKPLFAIIEPLHREAAKINDSMIIKVQE